ncbi:DEAD/DEAH box helicase [Lyngbya aestuarii]|uniref:DEAD/DEAH box helicase n=1 Tax=Lyngbya aestuarii TaxID=118322 RepID=UPI00403D9BD9
MIPAVVATQIRNCVSDYLRTTFRPTTPGFESLMERFLQKPDNVYRGPYVSLGLPFRSGTIGADYFPEIPLGFTPFLHQEQAFNRLIPPYYQSTLIATGTGSGKTECFLLPLLEHCRQQQGESGIKALLIYPMNALATDQAKRIAQFIHNTPSLTGKVTAGLYVGDSDETPTAVMTPDKIITDKHILRESPPDILLTNYKMLDYLLIQPDVQKLWRYNQPETLRYLIVDEFHTFDGAQGTDLACLLRRLKHRLQTPANHLTCVGTSATLGNKSDRAASLPENRTDILNYAQTIFQESFDTGALIEEDRLSNAEFLADALLNVLPLPSLEAIAQLQPDNYDSPEAYIRGQAQLWLQDFLNDNTNNPNPKAALTHVNTPLDDSWRIELGQELKSLPIIHNLVRILSQQSCPYSELLDTLSRRLHLPIHQHPEYCHLLFDSIFALIGAARRCVQRPDGQTLILPWATLRVQVWFRELKRMVASVESEPQLMFSDDLTSAMQDTLKTLPVIHCRDCGATGWGGVQPYQNADKLLANDLRGFYQAFFSRKPLVSFIFPCDRQANYPDFRLFCGHCLTLNLPRTQQCKSCNAEDLIPVRVPNHLENETHNGQPQTVINCDCPFCESRNGLSILGAQAASLTSAMIGVLYTTPYNPDKKLLTFSDSVQDAAHRAGFYGARTYRTTLRTAIFQLLANHQHSLTLQELVEQFPVYWQSKFSVKADYVASFLPTDLQWLREWDKFINSDRADLDPDTNLPNLVNDRLVWEIVTQFGHRAAVGPSLERSGVCSVSFNRDRLEKSTQALHFKLSNEVESLRGVSTASIGQFILGLLHHLRQRGGILQPATQAQYISSGGNTFLWTKLTYMPRLGPGIPAPRFLVNAAAKTDRFERVLHPGKQNSWCEDWTTRVFKSESLLLKDQLIEILHTTLDTLVDAGLLEVRDCANGRAWGIPMSAIEIKLEGTVLACDRCHHQFTVPPTSDLPPESLVCHRLGCQGHYAPDPRTGLAYYRQIYQQGEVKRIVAAEHTGLLARSNRERLEQQFIRSDRRCDPNLLSATSTLEMGINIGDLSTVLLCSVPPSLANFQQRIGRAGRREGNALVGLVANGKPHDLFFYADPRQMLDGSVEAAGCYLNASAILERQLTAFCLDNWVATGITRQEFPPRLSDILNAVQRHDETRFPYNWFNFIQEQQSTLLEAFLALFTDTIEPRTQQQLRDFMAQGDHHQGGLRWRILNRLEGVKHERTRLNSQITLLTKKIKDFKVQPEALQDSDKLNELEGEKAGFRELIRHLNEKNIFNFLTDEGLLPNYSFPEAGVTLRSILWRKLQSAEEKNGKRYETFTMTYERPSQLAIRELVPSGVFYAEGRRVKIDQIDLKLSQPEEWRICRSCNYATLAFQPEAQQKACPRCGDVMWSDRGRLRQMLRLRQVMASTSDKHSRFGDDSEDRNTAFFQRHLLIDFSSQFREKTFLVDDPDFPFGFEYISRTSFREINLGESLATGETVEIAGQRFTTQGFRVCRNCGKVMKGDRPQDHTIGCQWRDKPEQAKALEVLYLYREFESESIRLLMPDESFWTTQGLHSFIAAIQLGLKQKFGGRVDHLRTTVSEEPQGHTNLRKSFLYLYDSVPGGTGYLRQLIRNPQELKDVFQRALDIVRVCSCKDSGEDGCYKCLFAYRNSFYQDNTSRKAAETLLSKLLKYWSKLQEKPESLSAIRINSNFESELERRFIEAIRRYSGSVYEGNPPLLQPEIFNGKTGYYLKLGEMAWTIETQVTLGKSDGVDIPSRADFIFRPASSRIPSLPLVIFTDGWEYHRERMSEDFQQRTAILRSGKFWCWSLTWDDVMRQINPKHQTSVTPPDGLNCQLNPQFQQGRQQLYQQYQCSSLHSLENLGSFEWLMHYLAQPEFQQWQRWALLRTLAQADTKSLNDSRLSQPRLDHICTYLSQEAVEQWQVPPKLISGAVQISANLNLSTLVDLNRHRQLDPTGSFVMIELNDLAESNGDELQGNWQESLRLLNLYQFLPFSYAVTTTGIEQGITPSLPRILSSNNQPNSTQIDSQWEQIRQLTVEDDLLPAIERMSREGWLIPEAGYELEDKSGAVVAIAELAWLDPKVAVTLTPEDRDAFAKAGWTTWMLEDFLSSLDTLSKTLKGDK